MVAQQLNIDVCSNNLANVNTLAFKKSRAEFEDLLYQNLKIAGTPTEAGNLVPVGMQVGMGVKPTAVHKFFSQGDFQNTGNPLDMVIEGDGFFQVDFNGNMAYTRAGSFKLDNEGVITTANGYKLQPEFTVPAETTNVVINENGHISCQDKNGNEIAGTDLSIHGFINPAGLKSIGKNLFIETEASGAAVEGTPGEDNLGTIGQGFLEMSNVEIVEEMVNMIVGQRAYEINSKSVTTSDSMLQMANQMKRG
jgi:flagellar basal-body rod protein FlgG